MRIVFDTNVLFAALVSRTGFCARVVEECLSNHEIFICEFIMEELARNLEQKSRVKKQLIDKAIESLVSEAVFVEPANVAPDVVRDPSDVAILGTAIAARADVLISGDRDLLSLASFGAMPVISPRQFHDRYLIAHD